MKAAKDLFSDQASIYKKYRPTYPKELYDLILHHVKERKACWDVGCGNGQVAVQLCEHFDRVFASDLSKSQIINAAQKPNISYQVGRAEKTDFSNDSFDLVTVGQAIHWFDHEAFNSEVKRVLKPGGTLAFWSYELLQVSDEIDAIILDFYRNKISAYWAPERRHIDEHYENIPFPFNEINFGNQRLFMKVNWSLEVLEGYFNSWSSVQKYKKVHEDNPIEELINTIRPLWEGTFEVVFPIHLRIGIN